MGGSTTTSSLPLRPSGHLSCPFHIRSSHGNFPDARSRGAIVLSTWLTPRPRGHALAGATGIKPPRSSRVTVKQTLRSSPPFLFPCFYTGYTRDPVPYDRETPPSYTSKSPYSPSCSYSLFFLCGHIRSPGGTAYPTQTRRIPSPGHPLSSDLTPRAPSS